MLAANRTSRATCSGEAGTKKKWKAVCPVAGTPTGQIHRIPRPPAHVRGTSARSVGGGAWHVRQPRAPHAMTQPTPTSPRPTPRHNPQPRCHATQLPTHTGCTELPPELPALPARSPTEAQWPKPAPAEHPPVGRHRRQSVSVVVVASPKSSQAARQNRRRPRAKRAARQVGAARGR